MPNKLGERDELQLAPYVATVFAVLMLAPEKGSHPSTAAGPPLATTCVPFKMPIVPLRSNPPDVAPPCTTLYDAMFFVANPADLAVDTESPT